MTNRRTPEQDRQLAEILEGFRKWRASLSREELERLKNYDDELYDEHGLPRRSGSRFDLTDIATITVRDGQVVETPKKEDSQSTP